MAYQACPSDASGDVLRCLRAARTLDAGRVAEVHEGGAVSLTGDLCASMRWTVRGYFKKIYVEYGLALDGWPDFLFANLSELTSYAKISALFVLWQVGILRFIPVPLDRRAREVQDPLAVAPSRHNAGIPPSLGRSDIKKRYGRKRVDPAKFPPRYPRNGPKSDKWVSPEVEARAEAEWRLTRGPGSEDPSDPITSDSDCSCIQHLDY